MKVALILATNVEKSPYMQYYIEKRTLMSKSFC